MAKATKPKVAVITRTKDRAILLERAIQSIHSQSMKDFVHVIINDAGDPRVVDDLLKKHEVLIGGRVRVIHNTSSGGMEAASNKAIKSVDSTYVAIHDDDDSWHQDFLKKTTEYMDTTGAMGVVVTTDKIDEEIKNNKVRMLSKERWLPEVRVISIQRQFVDNLATPITFIYRREVYKTIGYYNEDLPVAGDWDFALRFLLHFDIDFLPTKEALANYHHRSNTVGINQNSVFVDNGLRHEQILNRLVNHYIREDIQNGVVGLGYYISAAQQSKKAGSELMGHVSSKIDANTVRLEGHINHTAKHLKADIGDMYKRGRALDRIKNYLARTKV